MSLTGQSSRGHAMLAWLRAGWAGWGLVVAAVYKGGVSGVALDAGLTPCSMGGFGGRNVSWGRNHGSVFWGPTRSGGLGCPLDGEHGIVTGGSELAWLFALTGLRCWFA